MRLLAKNKSAHGWRKDGDRLWLGNPGGQRGPKPLDSRHVLEGERALEVLAAVQPATQHKMPFQKGASIEKNLQNLLLGHAPRLSAKTREFNPAAARATPPKPQMLLILSVPLCSDRINRMTV